MNHQDAAPAKKLWSRDTIPDEFNGPKRSAGGFYRSAAKGKDFEASGIPLNTANDAIVAAVRLGYKVAESVTRRGWRFADGLRAAGDRAVGPESDRKALDAAEKVVFNALMSGLSWWEGSVADGRCPVKRLAAAEYQMLGSLLGLGPAAKVKSDDESSTEFPDPSEQERNVRAAGTPSRSGAPGLRRLDIVHGSLPKYRRPVLVESWNISRTEAMQQTLYFHSTEPPDMKREQFPAEFRMTGSGNASLRIATGPEIAPGRWRAVICDDQGLQLGFIEIVL